jgi:FixJ family two-component response regulator
MRSLDGGADAPLVCVVDDDLSLLRGLRRLLGARGLTVETFPSAEAFLAFPQRARTACLVLDLHLGGMSGLELQEHLRAGASRLPVIFVTADDDQPTRERAERAGAVAYLSKPFDDHALLAAIDRALGRS